MGIALLSRGDKRAYRMYCTPRVMRSRDYRNYRNTHKPAVLKVKRRRGREKQKKYDTKKSEVSCMRKKEERKKRKVRIMLWVFFRGVNAMGAELAKRRALIAVFSASLVYVAWMHPIIIAISLYARLSISWPSYR